MKKYLVLFLIILGFFAYGAYQELAKAHRELTPGQARYKGIVEHVVMLEERRMTLFQSPARGRVAHLNRSSRKAARVPAGTGSYGRGYAMGYYEGYATGEYLSASRKPNPLFFEIPQPN